MSGAVPGEANSHTGGPEQAPRLTSILREHGYSTASSAVPLDSLHCRHQSELQHVLQAYPSSSGHLLGPNPQDAAHSARAANSNWLNAVRKAAGVDIAGEELQNLATDVFWLLRSYSVDEDAVSRLLGSGISAQHLADLQEARTALAKERQKLQLASNPPDDVWSAQFFQPAEVKWPESWEEAMQGLYRHSDVLSQAIPTANGSTQSYQVSVADAEAQWEAYKEAARVVPTAEPEDIPHVMDGRERTVAKMNLTALERIVCRITGQSPPSKGGDESVLLLTIRALLQSDKPDATAGELVDVLGLSHMDQISHIVTMREGVMSSLKRALDILRAQEQDVQSQAAIQAQVQVNTTSQKAIQKLERKALKKKGQASAQVNQNGIDLEQISAYGWAALQDTEVDYSNLLSIGGMDISIGQGAEKKSLPPGTKRNHFEGYEVVDVPAMDPNKGLPPPNLVKISVLEDWAQTAFKGYKTLNRIQSEIFQTGYHSNANMLVCAPTGAGKTNIAMIAVLHEIGLHISSGSIQKDNFKIVYVAPMKALAAEVSSTFGKRLADLGIQVRELTGDMQLSKAELAATQMIVTTPEKWDVITRKGGNESMSSLVRLLIIDEVHLLNDDRGPVIETLVARTLRLVETSQTMIRIVGLSATLPNYQDVATFLGVNPRVGLFHFGPEYRPVPLAMSFVGVTEKNMLKRLKVMVDCTYERISKSLKEGNQAMVFVHSRKDTAKTAEQLAEQAAALGEAELFMPDESHPQINLIKKDVSRSRNGQVKELFKSGFGIHHAGMLRSDRNLVEKLFADGHIKVLCCTATLAWGVNLPAHTVIIKGTQVYDSSKGRFADLGLLDVQQMFGRAGRPQFDTFGEATIITTHDKLAHYLSMLTCQVPIESAFSKSMPDNLNAEVVLGTVSTVSEAVTWLSYSYLHVRMQRNPLAYGMTHDSIADDPGLDGKRRDLIIRAAQTLHECQMMRYDAKSGSLHMTELGRIASHFYISHASINTIKENLKSAMTVQEVFLLIAECAEFESLKVRDEEMPDLEKLRERACKVPLTKKDEGKVALGNREGKVQVLIQSYISNARTDSFSLIADMLYIGDNAPRIARALFEIALKKQYTGSMECILQVCKMLEKRLWPEQHPLWQFPTLLESHYITKLEKFDLWPDALHTMEPQEIGSMLRFPAAGHKIKDALKYLPNVAMECIVTPITRTVLRVLLKMRPDFTWRDSAHGHSMRWILWVGDSENDFIYYNEVWTLTKKMMQESELTVNFTIPIFEPIASNYYVRLISQDWLEAEAFAELKLHDIILPQIAPPHTALLDLTPLPRSVLKQPQFEALYKHRFTHFNPIQTQAFHTLYHTDENVLLGAPTGSGKTVSSELTMLRVFLHYPTEKILYVAPLKALVRERIIDWGKGLCKALNKQMVELTGDYTPDLAALIASDIIICTPEKWDGISRNWQARSYVQQIRLVVMDEIHLLGSERGPTLEAIVSRMRYISTITGKPVRFVGLSTALANAHDLASWLGVKRAGLFNFKPAVRPVPLEAHIQGYPGKFYCPRMASMNKPSYAAIQNYSPNKPILIFVSSRRQTRLTALDLIAFAASDMRPNQWMHMDPTELKKVLAKVRDSNLQHTLQFGIGLHHAALPNSDRELVEALFCEQKIQVLVATSTLAWGVNTPAHLVIIKGTEFFDGKTKRYVDYPITDVLQMIGRAGRPQFDDKATAVMLVHEPKKGFYKKFLYEPFPVESALHEQFVDHLNAEVVGGTVKSAQDAVDYLTWTYLYCRLAQNPSYYGMEGSSAKDVADYLSALVEESFGALEEAGCIELHKDCTVETTMAGRIASYYYLKHDTMSLMMNHLHEDTDFKTVLQVLSSAPEYDELPVRHNEDQLNMALSDQVRWSVNPDMCDQPHTKANLLFQAHFSHVPLPISDYITDTKLTLDNAIRLLQAMIDTVASQGWFGVTRTCIHLVQSVVQGQWPDDPSIKSLPNIDRSAIKALRGRNRAHLRDLIEAIHRDPKKLRNDLEQILSAEAVEDCLHVLARMPSVQMRCQKPQLQAAAEQDDGSDGGDQYRLQLTLKRKGLATFRQNGSKTAGQRARVYAPRFPKIVEEGWFVVLEHVDTGELLGLKRVKVSAGGVSHTSMLFPVADDSGERISAVDVHLLPDCYLGLDQVMRVSIEGKSDSVSSYVKGAVQGLDSQSNGRAKQKAQG